MEEHQDKKLKTMETSITIRLPDDYHHHVRDGKATSDILQHATKRFGRCLCMPNLKPPVTTVEMALEYKQRILASMPSSDNTNVEFQPLMTLYLTDNTTPEEIRKASELKNDDGITPTVIACKYYPAGATTNSEYGVSDITKVYPTIAEMEAVGMVLCIHSEVTHADIFEREPIFIEEVMKPLVAKFPKLKITMEHISTKEAVDYVLNEAPPTVKASITCHHLIYNRNGTCVFKKTRAYVSLRVFVVLLLFCVMCVTILTLLFMACLFVCCFLLQICWLVGYVHIYIVYQY